MNKIPKVYQVIQCLSTSEKNKFSKFLGSPYHNSREIMSILFVELQTVDYNQKYWKNVLWQNMNLSDELEDGKLRKLFSDLLNLLKEFLALEQFKKDENFQSFSLLKFIQNRDISVLKKSALVAAETNFSQKNVHSSADYFFFLQILKIRYNLEDIDLKRISRNKDITMTLNTMKSFIEKLYYSEVLRYHVTGLTWNRILKTEDNLLEVKSKIQSIESSSYPEEVSISTYLSICKTLIEPENFDNFDKLLNTIQSHISEFDDIEAKNIFDSALNFILRGINSGKISLLNQLFELYVIGLRNSLLSKNDELSPWTFKNVVTCALRLKRMKWVKSFVVEYIEKVHVKYRESIQSLCNAQIAYYDKDYGEVLRQLQKVQFNEFSLKVNAEVTLIATYYDTDEHSLLFDQLNNFQTYLRRQSRKNVNQNQIVPYLNMVKFVKKLTKATTSSSINGLRHEIEKTIGLASKTWLLEKVDELLGVPTTNEGD